MNYKKELIRCRFQRMMIPWMALLLLGVVQNVCAQNGSKKGPARASRYTYLPSGYTQVGTTQLYYKQNSDAIDMIGYYNGYYYSSTYSDYGYKLSVQVGTNSATRVNCLNGTTSGGVTVQPSVEQQGELARICYTVTNTNETDVVISLGTHADVMIGNNDRAPISRRVDTTGNIYGVTMKDGNGAQLCVLFGSGLAGVTSVNDYWFGYYGLNREPDQMVGNYSSGESYMEENGSYDSGMGWCWKNRTIPVGATVVFSYLIGVGEVNLEPNSSFEVTPDDPEGWNDLSRPHKLTLDGTYESPAGLDGMIEYAVEDSEEWQQLTAMLPSGSTFCDTLVAMFDATREKHVIRFRTRDNVGNTTLLPSIEYLDVSFHEYTGIVDKTYTGDSIYQEVSCVDVEGMKFSTGRYNGNVNAGVATFCVEGVFPYTIGRKACSFRINPAQLTGGIDLSSDSLVYNGQEHLPSWSFTNESYEVLEESKDYHVSYIDNIYPGTGKVRIEGIGNYTSELEKTFFIDKGQLSENLYSIMLPADDISYDENEHKASATASAGVGEFTFTYTLHDETEVLPNAPVNEGHYDVYCEIADGEWYYGQANEYVGSFSIYRFDEDEWQSLAALYAELQQMNVPLSWNMANGAKSVCTFEGLHVEEGHVVGISLPNKGMAGLFPGSLKLFTKLKDIDLSHNHLSGDIAVAIAAVKMQDSLAFNSLKTLDISDNLYHGNLGVLANCMPSLMGLNASHNKFEDLYPELPATITDLDISNQHMERVVELDMSNLSLEDLNTKVPTILLYDQVNRVYRNSINLLCTKADLSTFNKYDTDEWAMQLQIEDNQISIPYVSAQNAYYGESGDTLNVLNMIGNDATDGCSFRISLSFNQGDANFDGKVNVLDLQTMINYIMEKYQDRPYNFTASNLWLDEQVNVQDVICQVNLLLGSNENTEYSGMAKANRVVSYIEEPYDATVYIQNGMLKINSNIPVSAFDFTIAGTDNISINNNILCDMEVSQKSIGNGVRVIGYSLNGSTISSGDITIGSTEANAALKSVMLSDSDAISIRTSINQVPTGIHGVNSNETGTVLYDVQGRRVLNPSPNTIYINKGRKVLK